MPELPDVEIYKKSADKSVGSKIETIEITDEKFTDASKNLMGRYIKNREVKKTRRKGKYLFIEMDNKYALVMHFGMTGFLSYIAKTSETPSYARCIFELSNNHKLIYISKRKLGKIEITNDIKKYTEKQDLGPDALEISRTGFLSKIKGSKAMVKSFLMDQSALSGIGNVYADEILFHAGIHPGEKAHQLKENQKNELYKQIGRVLRTAINKQAKINRMPDDFMLPKRKEGEKCPRCNGKIKKIKISGRTGYYCPQCQRKSK